MKDNLDNKKYPKIVVMTQTREKEYHKLNSFLSIKEPLSKWNDNLKFIVNYQLSKDKYQSKIINHKKYIEYKTNFISLSKARNDLLKISQKLFKNFDFYIHIDDDAYIYDFNILLQSLLYLKRRNFEGLIIGSICKPNLEPINKHIKNFKNFKELNILNHNSIMGSCICYGNEITRRKIEFDEEFGLGSRFGGSEETEFFFKTLFKKIRIIYNPCFLVIHPPTYKYQYNFQKMFNYGSGRGAVYKKYLNKNYFKFYSFLLISLFCNLLFSVTGFLFLNKSFGTRNIALFLGKIYGFKMYKNQ